MSAPLPEALRARFQRYIEEGVSDRAAALRLKLSPATGARWALAIRRTGRAEAAPQGQPKGRGKLDPHRDFFAEIIAQDGDITMPELSAALFDATHVRAHPNAIGKFLRKLGYTYKKVTGGHRTPPCQGKTTARGLVQAPHSSSVKAPGPCCLHY
ncbi:transposase [Shimia litoralis]|uniref:transposase n=1 Tax=Shimia litoralis TaxID=420403 RepID=UPI000068AE29|nr:transposase [Shimia litoralis]EAQ43589.1 ISSpo6, transposase orf A [Roseobacter sp. MED193]